MKLTELVTLNTASGQGWFMPGEMSFMDTHIESDIINGRYFITSEKVPGLLRRFTIRAFDAQGRITTVGHCCAYLTRAAALAEIPTQ